eukprot:scaffold157158_cov22-Tisochrysis_lutea.AAC.4
MKNGCGNEQMPGLQAPQDCAHKKVLGAELVRSKARHWNGTMLGSDASPVSKDERDKCSM